MGGWPNRTSRQDFSPGDCVDEKKVENPTFDIGADFLNLSYWQTAGIGRAVSKFVLFIDPISETLRYGLFGWDPLSPPRENVALASAPYFAWTKHAVGDYELDFDTQVADMNGDLVPLTLVAVGSDWLRVTGDSAQLAPMTTSAALTGNSVRVRLIDGNLADVDTPFILVGE